MVPELPCRHAWRREVRKVLSNVVSAAGRTLSIAFVVPYGEPADGFFGDTLLSLLCDDARTLGHRAEVVRVYYDGRDPARDDQVRHRLMAWLDERSVEVVVVERLFDSSPLDQHLARSRAQGGIGALVQVTLGDSLEPQPGVDFLIGATPGNNRRGTRRSPRPAEVREGFAGLLDAWTGTRALKSVPGLARCDGGAIVAVGPPSNDAPRRRFRPVLEQSVICLVPPPRIIRKTLHGNAGCPFAADPLEQPHYRGLTLPVEQPIARLGCAFCHMGGDYERRPDAEVVEELVEQALWFTQGLPGIEELVLTDQQPTRYLETLVRTAHARGVRPVRWLFAARADSFVRERERIERAVRAAAELGHALEVYLSGFESFSDDELARYNKGVDSSQLLTAVEAMRELARAHPGHFELDQARGHSLILWSPWTTPADLRTSATTVRTHRLRGLFDELGRNRLRLHRDLPIYYAAVRDELVLEEWSAGDDGAGRRKGYSTELPWRFQDPRTQIAYELATELRERYGHETEVAQLLAVAAHVEAAGLRADDRMQAIGTLVASVAALDARLIALARHETVGVRRPSYQSAEPVVFAGACNNGCAGCAHRDRDLPDHREALVARVEVARTRSVEPLCFAGREPTLHPSFFELVARARGDDGRHVGLVSNGRRFSNAAFAAAAVRAGLASASIKLFGASAADADAHTRDPGGFEQALAGCRELLRAGVAAIELRISLGASPLRGIEEVVRIAARNGITQMRVEVALDVLGLSAADDACRAIDALVETAGPLGVALGAAPLSAGTRDFSKIPAGTRAAGAARVPVVSRRTAP